MYHDQREEWLSDLAKRTGLTTLEFDQAGVCQLVLDCELILTLCKPDTSTKLVVFGQLPMPPLPVEVIREMLKRNRSSARVTAPVISLSPDEDAIEVHLVLDQGELGQSEDALEKLISELDYWRNAALSDFRKEGDGDPIDPNISFV